MQEQKHWSTRCEYTAVWPFHFWPAQGVAAYAANVADRDWTNISVGIMECFRAMRESKKPSEAFATQCHGRPCMSLQCGPVGNVGDVPRSFGCHPEHVDGTNICTGDEQRSKLSQLHLGDSARFPLEQRSASSLQVLPVTWSSVRRDDSTELQEAVVSASVSVGASLISFIDPVSDEMSRCFLKLCSSRSSVYRSSFPVRRLNSPMRVQDISAFLVHLMLGHSSTVHMGAWEPKTKSSVTRRVLRPRLSMTRTVRLATKKALAGTSVSTQLIFIDPTIASRASGCVTMMTDFNAAAAD
eukprot:CAMPEP_0194483308 /NCGR_PEP_ID=MMETSP0253-20130528/4974_1 /TAXON_ID=2966 /ORGANISM="Noctiluca scintillans" /LENGTH=297 /DNA_ID=CAMNT_0039322965 /DNA_START=610 /DNA_END=1504 /DNA_ORIENTATION=-